MKKIVTLMIVLALLLQTGCTPAPAAPEPAEPAKEPSAAGGMLIENGLAQQIAAYTDPMDLSYTNEGSELLRYVVYVETDLDTDMDGKPDLVKTMVQVPRAAAEGGYKAPVLYEARPYIAGMYAYHQSLPEAGSYDFDISAMYAQPEKRTAAGTATTLEHAAKADPADWNYTFENDPFGQEFMQNLTTYDYYLVRGFAVVQSAGLGTWGSEGLECCASRAEADAFRCIAEWLTGKRPAYTDKENNIAIEADWSSGHIGMTGRSYAGAMAFEVAASGVEGLDTIVPVAGPSCWYEYNCIQGIHSGLFNNYDFITDLAATCASRMFADVDPDLVKTYEKYLASLRDAQIALDGDYGDFWAERDFSVTDGLKCSALIVQGLNDVNVRPKNFDLMRDAFLRCGCDVKALLHQNGHVTPANEQMKLDIMIGDHTYTELLNLWFTHELLGVDNEAAEMPAFTVQSNVDGKFYGTEEWKTGNALELISDAEGEAVVSAEGAQIANPTLVDNTLDGASGADHLLLTSMDVEEAITVNGPVALHVRTKTDDLDTAELMLSALLVDAADEPFLTYDVGWEVLEAKRTEVGGVPMGEGVPAYDLAEYVQKEMTRKIVAYGSMDLRNPEAGYEPYTAVRRSEPIEAGEWYDYTIWLQPNYYTVQPGHRLEVYVLPFCGFSSSDLSVAIYTPEELEGFGIDPKGLVPFSQDYSFTVDCGTSSVSIPVTSK